VYIHLSEREAAALIAALTGQAADAVSRSPLPVPCRGYHARLTKADEEDEVVNEIPQNWAAVCARGHVQSSRLSNFVHSAIVAGLAPEAPDFRQYCGSCGTRILVACRNCGKGIAGEPEPNFYGWGLDSFCWNCGVPYPWATREQRLGQLYNFIDEEDLDEAEHLAVVEQIAVLSEPVDEVSDEDRVRAGQRLRGISPKVWEAALPILQTLLTAKAKQELGLPP
jgi:hypothetical protein